MRTSAKVDRADVASVSAGVVSLVGVLKVDAGVVSVASGIGVDGGFGVGSVVDGC